MEKVFLGVLEGAVDPQVISAARAALDFIYYAQLEVHTTETLERMEASWKEFHAHKQVFVFLGVRLDFNISKLHNVGHYVEHIRSRGTADGFNTEATERLHIDFAKVGYRASNHRGYISQMTKSLQRREAAHRFSEYLQWALKKDIMQEDEVVEEDDDDDDDNDGAEEELAENEVNDREVHGPGNLVAAQDCQLCLVRGDDHCCYGGAIR